MARPRVDLTGQRFGRLVATSPAAPDGVRTRWLCRCDCGVRHIVRTESLTCGYTRSCGCLRREVANAQRGQARPGWSA